MKAESAERVRVGFGAGRVATLTAVLAMPAWAAAQSVVVINDFEPGGTAALGFSAEGALSSLTTEAFNGSTAAKAVTNPIPGFFAALLSGYATRDAAFLPALAAGTQLQFDIGNTAAGIVNPDPNPFFLVRFSLNTDAWVGGGNNYRGFDNIFLGKYDQAGTLSIGLSAHPEIGQAALNYAAGGGSYFGFVLDNAGYPPDSVAGNTFYVDNVRVSGVTTDKVYQRSGSGDWNGAGSWNGSAPNAAGAVVVLGPSLTAASTLYTDVPVTAGTIQFDSPVTYVVSGAGRITLATGSGAALIDVLRGSHKFALPVTVAGDTTVAVTGSAALLFADEVTVPGGGVLTKTGDGTVTFAGRVNTPGATVRLKGGTVNLDVANTDGTLSFNVDPATLNIGASQVVNRLDLDAGGNVLNVGQTSGGAVVSANLTAATLAVINGGAGNTIDVLRAGNVVQAGALSVEAGASLRKAGPGRLSAGQTTLDGALTQDAGSSALGVVTGAGSLTVNGGTVEATRVRVGGLAVADGATVTLAGGTSVLDTLAVGSGGRLDLATGNLVLQSASAADLAAVRAAVGSWYAGGARNGNGIAATAGAFTTLAVFPNEAGAGVAYFDTFDGVGVAAGDVIVRYTYVGDTDLNGRVDGTDLARLIEGLTTGASGWQNGDLNYDGAIDGADLSLLNAALAGQGAPLGAIGTLAGAVPEPASAAAGLVLAAVLGRRRR